jgi:hypothetical protein
MAKSLVHFVVTCLQIYDHTTCEAIVSVASNSTPTIRTPVGLKCLLSPLGELNTRCTQSGIRMEIGYEEEQTFPITKLTSYQTITVRFFFLRIYSLE